MCRCDHKTHETQCQNKAQRVMRTVWGQFNVCRECNRRHSPRKEKYMRIKK